MKKMLSMRADLNNLGVRSININLFNTGSRTVELRTLFVYVKNSKKKGLVFISPGVSHEFVIELPQKLDPDESMIISLSHSWCKREFTKMLSDKEKRMSENDKISFFVRDSHGKEYRAKSKITYAEFLAKYANTRGDAK